MQTLKYNIYTAYDMIWYIAGIPRDLERYMLIVEKKLYLFLHQYYNQPAAQSAEIRAVFSRIFRWSDETGRCQVKRKEMMQTGRSSSK